jgi:hypothetical protein
MTGPSECAWCAAQEADSRGVILRIERHPPVSLNAVLSMNRWDRSRHKTLWKSEAMAAWMNAGCPWFERCAVHIRLFYRGDRVTQDDDNMIGACKPILDGLKGRAFPDDNADTIKLVVERVIDNESPRVEIQLGVWD